MRLTPVLLGTKGEAGLAGRFLEQADFPVINLMGETSLTELAGVLSQCRALVTNDTGTMHLAAGVGVPICSVFLATAQPWDTGPYRAGNISLEPDMACHPCEFGKACPNEEACRGGVTPQAMFAALCTLLDETPFPSISGARVWQSRIGDDGMMELVSLSGHDETDRALWIAMQRAHYLPFLDRRPDDGVTGLAVKMSSEIRAELFKVLTNAHDMLFLFSQQCMLLTRNPRPQAKKKFLASWQQLQNILGESQYLNLLGLLWMFDSQRAADDLSNLLPLIEHYKALFASLRDEFI